MNDALKSNNLLKRKASFSETLAVGGSDYLSRFHSAIGIAHRKRKIVKDEAGFCIKETASSGNTGKLIGEKALFVL